jgi:Retroviral aspartyl protease
MIITEVEEIKVKAFLDLRYMKNYINLKWLRKYQIAERKKSNSYIFFTFDDQLVVYNEDWVTKEIPLVTIKIGSHEKTLVMDVIEISDYDITLDLSWLRKYKSNINYKKGTVIFNNYNYSSQLKIEEILLKEMTR